ncbi:MAG: hypothetical protein Q9168_002798 [Polycauliona sp. 1 TL-2023]
MSSTGSLGPLETLLLLQGLQISDPGAAPFGPVSETLKARDTTHQNGSPNAERFEPKSLELLYLRLLKEEAKSESRKTHGSELVQDGERDARDGKPSSPSMETMEEAWHYRHLIPQLATHVYDSHREAAVKAIEDEERKYQALTKDIQEIERGEWDSRLQPQEQSSRRGSKSVSSIQTLLQDEPISAPDTIKTISGPPSIPAPPFYGKDGIKSSPPNLSAAETQPQTAPYANGDAGPVIPITTGNIVPSSAVPAGTSPKKQRQSLYIPHQAPSNVHKPPSQPTSTENGAPFLPPPHHPNQGYGITSPSPDLHRRPSSQPANIAPSPSTRPHQTPRQPPERSSGSPIILPPPAGMLRSNSSASGPLDPLADMTGNQYRPNAMPSPRPHPPNSSQHPVQLPLPPIHGHKPYQYPQYDNRSPYQNAYPPYHPGTLPPYQPQTHPHVAPYQHPTHHPAHQPQYPPRQQYQSPAQAYPQYSPYGNAAPYNSQHGQAASPYGQYPPTRSFAPQTPIYASGARRKPQPSPINTSVSSTKWKKFDRPDDAPSPKSPIAPGPDEISPITEKAPSPVAESLQTHSRRKKPQGDLPSPATEDLPQSLSHTSTVKRGRGRPRGSANRGRGGRAPSIASSALPARSRSPSVTSGVDELSLGAPTSANNRPAIKPEPPATPARDSSASIPPSAPADDGSRKSTRRRRGTLRGVEATAESARISTKRKRTIDTSEMDSRSVVRSELEKQREELSATHILASRNFPRTSATLMNDISAHKLANIFAKPLTEREAPGYPSFIYRPQDLKSIKQAITIGNRALTAYIEQERDEDGDGNSSSKDIIPIAGASEGDVRVWVKKHEDFLPPKGIVNSAQLEKEIMRVFANAVMFNPDPKRSLVGPAYRTRARVQQRHIPVHLDGKAVGEDDEGEDKGSEGEGGVVKDARDMFEDVERVVEQWRAAERAAEEGAIMTGSGRLGRVRGGEGEEEDADELAGDESGVAVEEEEVAERAGKRRRR